jgi:hypothetical protein
VQCTTIETTANVEQALAERRAVEALTISEARSSVTSRVNRSGSLAWSRT